MHCKVMGVGGSWSLLRWLGATEEQSHPRHPGEMHADLSIPKGL
jgi:hypothetical protein